MRYIWVKHFEQFYTFDTLTLLDPLKLVFYTCETLAVDETDTVDIVSLLIIQIFEANRKNIRL